ncbi:hypothetical protein T652_24880 [Klebsiella pneumoniae MRSN 3562]|nr:hypothetical protein T652_24880 [Klebsiella pneumoniae MRSN 3562]KKJ65176.1 hypothetical protein T644_00845 [Klebsiella pneumoniae MRSN 2404]
MKATLLIGQSVFSQVTDMLIEIINTQDVDLNNANIHSSLCNLFCSFREGKHLILTDVDFLHKVSDFKELGSLTCNTAQNLIQKTREFKQLKNLVSYYCKVDMKNSSSSYTQDKDEGNFFTVGYSFFNDSSKIQYTKLLCEDISDYKLYKSISKFYQLINRMGGININFEVLNGGGANTKYNFDKILEERFLCLCLLDSDKKHPKSGYGSTASKFNDESDSAICKHYTIESHEVEALIPTEIVDQCIINKTIEGKYLNALEQIKALTNHSPTTKLYFDHKEGFTIRKVIEIDEKYKDNYWKDAIVNAPNFKRKGCLEKLQCDCTPPCMALDGFGTGLLEACSTVIERMSHIKLNESLSPILINEWNKIGLKLLSWGCSSHNKTRTS